ncbi:hypothetical protein F4780DRAFT_249770 [Xylariomycetidae sp. FL0641]|nr:hypothetical protein F4780DRAFT_249770 [Xylariomycetidae sp. FL0641]
MAREWLCRIATPGWSIVTTAHACTCSWGFTCCVRPRLGVRVSNGGVDVGGRGTSSRRRFDITYYYSLPSQHIGSLFLENTSSHRSHPPFECRAAISRLGARTKGGSSRSYFSSYGLSSRDSYNIHRYAGQARGESSSIYERIGSSSSSKGHSAQELMASRLNNFDRRFNASDRR